MVLTTRGAVGVLLIVLSLGAGASGLIHDTTGAQLQLAPVFVAAAVAAGSVRLLRARPRAGWRPRGEG